MLVGFLVAGIFLVLGSFFYSLFLSNGIIDFIVYIGLTIITAIFAGGIIIGINGCSDYNDSKSNGIAFILIIVDIFAIIFGFVTSMGLASAMSSVFNGEISSGSSSGFGEGSGSEYAFSSSFGFEPTTSPANSRYSPMILFEILIIGILTVVAGIG
ncbi:hypothetical protein ALNOE001_05700 [Candidatus Methanobinarius endosymbioticus]|uniref:Uncharacterized protein n=1 Tax=Candidatus Methanobinarius endosymbioticus TaxID=2006182 RepID=A0A366MEK8_9EURY|nr:hypothetical protein ALNOE001_05700 [Candidatus Methanobinarius endosymbioticus]